MELLYSLILNVLAFYVSSLEGFGAGWEMGKRGFVVQRQLRQYALAPALSTGSPESYECETEAQSNSAFDSDFAEAMSKPLPQWYKDSLVEREKLMEEIKRNRARIIEEFRAKYIEVTEDEKLSEKQRKEEGYKKRLEQRNKSSKKNWFQKAINVGNKQSGLFDGVGVEEAVVEDSESEISTEENWDLFWKEEEKQTGFNLPGFFEVFPELKFKWPTWARRSDGSAVRCETDADCPMPTACCPHPIIPGEKFCCTGWGRRIMVPAYAIQEIQPSSSDTDAGKNSGNGNGDVKERENWRPDK